MPVLYLAICIDGGEDISGFEVFVLWSPANVGEWGFALIGDCTGDIFLFQIEDLNRSIVAS